MNKLLTIIIPCRNEELYIGQVLRSISKQIGIGNTKIIIADANSTDNTLSVVEACKILYGW